MRMKILTGPFQKGKVTMYLDDSPPYGQMKALLIYRNKEIGSCRYRVQLEHGEHCMWVSDLDIQKSYQRKGLGRMLMEYVFYLAKYSKLPVELISTLEAENFYKKLRIKENKETGHFVLEN